MILLGIEDVTERIEGERVRAELLARAERAQGLAQQANEAKDHFLAMLSHELRTPLTSLLLQVELLRSGGTDPAKLKRVSAAVERGAYVQLKLVEELLDISRITAGKLHLEDRWVDLAPVVAAALELVKASAEAKSLRISTDVSAAIPLFRGDPTRLQQVVANLLSNSVKLTPEGGHVGVKLERVDGTARITVTDTGCGIPAVAFTALAGEQERARCLAAGFQAHLAKPATRDAVVAAVQSLLDPTRRAAPATPEIISSGS